MAAYDLTGRLDKIPLPYLITILKRNSGTTAVILRRVAQELERRRLAGEPMGNRLRSWIERNLPAKPCEVCGKKASRMVGLRHFCYRHYNTGTARAALIHIRRIMDNGTGERSEWPMNRDMDAKLNNLKRCKKGHK